MIRTKCPHCGKPLGVVDSAAGAVATCPGCKQKFRVPGAKAGAPVTGKTSPAPPKPAPKEEFPEVELVEDGEPVATRKAGQPPAKRRPVADDEDLDDDVVAQRDADEDEDDEPRKGRAKKKGKKSKKGNDPFMKVRNRIMGAVGALAGAGLIAFGIMNKEILNVTAQARQLNPSLETVPRIVTIAFGGLLVLVGGYYLVIDFFRE